MAGWVVRADSIMRVSVLRHELERRGRLEVGAITRSNFWSDGHRVAAPEALEREVKK